MLARVCAASSVFNLSVSASSSSRLEAARRSIMSSRFSISASFGAEPVTSCISLMVSKTVLRSAAWLGTVSSLTAAIMIPGIWSVGAARAVARRPAIAGAGRSPRNGSPFRSKSITKSRAWCWAWAATFLCEMPVCRSAMTRAHTPRAWSSRYLSPPRNSRAASGVFFFRWWKKLSALTSVKMSTCRPFISKRVLLSLVPSGSSSISTRPQGSPWNVNLITSFGIGHPQAADSMLQPPRMK